MTTQNTLYIAEPIFSEQLQKYDPESSFPPIKKIGITTDHPERREKELLGTKSPVKISIVKAWTGVEAKAIETLLHTILDNLRLDGEYFWDGNETLVDAVSDFISTYHPEAQEIGIENDADVKAASDAVITRNSKRIYTEVIPFLDELGVEYKIRKNDKIVGFHLHNYRLVISAKTGGRYTLTIFSKTKSSKEALNDFVGSQELSPHGKEESNRRARIPMASLETILIALNEFINNSKT